MDSSKISAVWEILLQLSLGDFFLPLKFATLWLKPSRGRWEKFSSCQNICSCSDSRSFFFWKAFLLIQIPFDIKRLSKISCFFYQKLLLGTSYFRSKNEPYQRKLNKVSENWEKSQKTKQSLKELSEVKKTKQNLR